MGNEMMKFPSQIEAVEGHNIIKDITSDLEWQVKDKTKCLHLLKLKSAKLEDSIGTNQDNIKIYNNLSKELSKQLQLLTNDEIKYNEKKEQWDAKAERYNNVLKALKFGEKLSINEPTLIQERLKKKEELLNEIGENSKIISDKLKLLEANISNK